MKKGTSCGNSSQQPQDRRNLESVANPRREGMELPSTSRLVPETQTEAETELPSSSVFIDNTQCPKCGSDVIKDDSVNPPILGCPLCGYATLAA
tara:strand:- start:1008 stop:1289 length:282 start_codon:yes stop_codon:yes gene_type:complete